MSADNYYLIRKHPDGGFAAVMGFESDERTPVVRCEHHQAFPTIDEAEDYAHSEYSEYGVSIHPECTSPSPAPRTPAAEAPTADERASVGSRPVRTDGSDATGEGAE